MASVALPVFEADGTFIGAMVVLRGLASRHNKQAQLKAADIVRRELGRAGFFGVRAGGWAAAAEGVAMPARRQGLR